MHGRLLLLVFLPDLGVLILGVDFLVLFYLTLRQPPVSLTGFHLVSFVLAGGAMPPRDIRGLRRLTTERKRVEANEMRATLDSRVAFLQGDMQRFGIEAALPVIEDWEGRIAIAGDPKFTPMVENLGALRAQP